jgi:hypothetical protein
VSTAAGERAGPVSGTARERETPVAGAAGEWAGRAGGAAAATLAVAVAWALGAPSQAEAQTWSTFQVQRQVQAEQELRVDVEFGAGRFNLAPATGGELYRVRLRYDEDQFEPLHRYQNGALRIGMEGTGRRIPRGESESELEVRLTRDVPTDLRMSFGAVRAELDLGGLRLRNLELSTGASDAQLRVSSPNPIALGRVTLKVGAAALRARELGHLNARELRVEAGVGDVRLDFEGLQRTETRLRASMGLGSLEIRVPEGVGIRLVRSTFLTSVSAPELTRRGDAYVSPEWDRAERRIEIEVDAAFGSITIRRTSG